MDDNGTYLGNIYGIYKECIRNIHRYLWYKIIRNTGAAFGGRPTGSVFLIILYRKYLWIFFIYSLYIPYMFPKYVPYIFPCVLLNLFNPLQYSKWPQRASKARLIGRAHNGVYTSLDNTWDMFELLFRLLVLSSGF